MPIAAKLLTVAVLLASVSAQDGDAPPVAHRSLRRQAAEVTVTDVERSLVAELAGNVSRERFQELEVSLKPTYDALPKEESGYLGHQAVRYALHRLLLRRHGWFIVGLEPSDTALPPYLHSDWIPQFLQGLLEQRLGDRGLDLKETAALAAALEDLVRMEASQRLDLVLGLLGHADAAAVKRGEVDRILETYMMMYLDGGNFSAPDLDLDKELSIFKVAYGDWNAAASWMQQIKVRHVPATEAGEVGRGDLSRMVNDLGEHFSAFNNGECRNLKKELMQLEGPLPGRIPLLDFYKKGLYSHWNFNEKADYLRVLGALDESKEAPSVILPNYVGSRPNCLAASRLYAICCRNECEDLMGHLERKLASPRASAQDILNLVAELPSETENTSRRLPEVLVERLHGIADKHGGEVPIHGRLFAQWMHHAYPRECPFPHESAQNPQTPDEWLRDAGSEQAEVRASQDEVRELLGDCVGGKDARCSRGLNVSAELPWTDGEVLLGGGQRQRAGPTVAFVLFKCSLLVTIVMYLSAHASGKFLQYAHRGNLKGERRARNLDFTADIEDLKQANRTMESWQKWLLLGLLVLFGATLELAGWLDRTTFGCTLLGGLLLNLVLPTALPYCRQQHARKQKHCA